MTTNRSYKELIRAAAEATGHSYAEIARLSTEFDVVLRKHPRLTAFGMGIFRDRAASADERQAKFEHERLALRDGFPTVVRVFFWLKAEIGMIKTPTRGSYGLKHVAENRIGHYVTNGEFIAAALMAGYPMRDSGGPNPLFAVRQRDVEAAVAAIEAAGRHAI